MRSCPSAVATASLAGSGATQDDRASFSVEPSSPGLATRSPSPSSSSSSLRPYSAVAAASHADPSVCSPEVTARMRFSSAVPCFNSITLDDAASCETIPEAGATPTGVDNVGAQAFPVTKEEKGLLFLGTGVSCALPQLAHVLPIADPNHPFHPFIHVPVEQLPSVATLHQLAAEHQHRQRQQRHQAGNLPGGDRPRKHSAAAASPQPRESHEDLSPRNNHVKVEASERPRGGKGLRRSSSENCETFLNVGPTGSEHVDTEVNTTVERKCSYTSAGKGGNREDQHTSAVSGSNSSERGCSDGSRSCSSGNGGIIGDQTITKGKCSSADSNHNIGRLSSGADGGCERTSESERIPDAVREAYPGCRLRRQADEYLEEDFRPAPACVSCFMSWKNSRDPNNRGNVCAVLKLGEGKAVLVDCGKTFRQAALAFCPRYGIRSLDAVLLTHDHQDAVGGLDDLRDMQRFCRPPCRKEALAVVRRAAQSPGAAEVAPPESGKSARVAAAAEEDKDVPRQKQIEQTLTQGEPPRSKRQRGEEDVHLAHTGTEASEPQPRDSLGYRPCYTLNCFLGARTYKTICTRYGYIVEASSKMAAWVSAALEQQQRHKSLQDRRRKPELEAAAGTEGHTQEQQEEGGKAGLLKGASSVYATERVAECGRENKEPEERTSNGKHMTEVHERDAFFDAPHEAKTRMAADEGSRASEICGVGGCVSARDFGTTGRYPSQQPRAPMCFPCSPLDPGWEEAPVFERKVACLAFHILADEVPRSFPGGLGGARLAVCGSSTSSSSSDEAREPSTATAVAGTTGSGGGGHQQDASALLPSYTKRATSPTLSGISASHATGKENVTNVSLQERTRDSAAESLPVGSVELPGACETHDNFRTKIALARADALEGEEHGGNLAEKTLAREARSFISASGAVNAADADAAGFCEVGIPGINTKVVSFPVFHGGTYVCLGYVIGSREKLVYMSDVKDVPSIVLERLKGIGDVHTLVIDALSEKLHNSHFSVQEALTVAVELQPREVYFVGMTCTLEHSQTNRRLRCWLQRHQELFRAFNGGRESRISHVALAFDGMFLPIRF